MRSPKQSLFRVLVERQRRKSIAAGNSPTDDLPLSGGKTYTVPKQAECRSSSSSSSGRGAGGRHRSPPTLGRYDASCSGAPFSSSSSSSVQNSTVNEEENGNVQSPPMENHVVTSSSSPSSSAAPTAPASDGGSINNSSSKSRDVGRYLWSAALRTGADGGGTQAMIRAFLEGRLGSERVKVIHEAIAHNLRERTEFDAVDCFDRDDVIDYLPLFLQLVQSSG